MSAEIFLNGRVQLCCGDSLHFLRDQPDNRYDSAVTDPPYALVSIVKRFGSPNAAPAKGNDAYMRASAGFMGKEWDTGETAFGVEFWAEVFRVLKPGGHLVAFGGTRTSHRMICAIEDAGFEIRDQLQWIYGSGFPKSHDVSKGIDRAAGAEREVIGSRVSQGGRSGGNNEFSDALNQDKQIAITTSATAAARDWDGWGTALKPACEPICLARKPLSENTVAANVLRWGTGAINVDGCRVATDGEDQRRPSSGGDNGLSGTSTFKIRARSIDEQKIQGRWPANVVHDGSDEVVGMFPDCAPATSRTASNAQGVTTFGAGNNLHIYPDFGSAARFFYSAKADSDDRLGSRHPTVKPVDLMQWLVRLVTPNGGLVLDPFAGTGTTAEACYREGMRCVLIEREAEYQADIRRRMALVMSGPDERSRESVKARMEMPMDDGPLFQWGNETDKFRRAEAAE